MFGEGPNVPAMARWKFHPRHCCPSFWEVIAVFRRALREQIESRATTSCGGHRLIDVVCAKKIIVCKAWI